jgi:hypothetical protein
MYPTSEVQTVLDLAAAGVSDRQITRQTGVSRATVRNWRHGDTPRPRRPIPTTCARCQEPATFESELGSEYSYLLGQYLGDGCVSANGTSFALQISSDAQYVNIIEECCRTIESIAGRAPRVRHDPSKRLAKIVSCWKPWPCLLPQHGPGRKHSRTIALAVWQVAIVEAHPGRFLRGLIHSDGWRGLNRVTVKGREYAYPRYQFSNRSDDIRTLFTYARELVGIEWRPWGRWHVSVARRGSVARLDEFVGPKR